MMGQKASTVFWHSRAISPNDHERLKEDRGFAMWSMGLSASGKSTLTFAIEVSLYKRGGDNNRHGLRGKSGFSPKDCDESIRRISEVAKLFAECGIINLPAFLPSYASDRFIARKLSGDVSFIEVFVDSPFEICEQRNPKGAYKKSRQGIIKQLGRVSAPYAKPQHPKIHLRAGQLSIEEGVQSIISHLLQCKYTSMLWDVTMSTRILPVIKNERRRNQ